MDRREFIKKSVKMGAAASAAALTGDFSRIFAAENSAKPFDVVAVKGGGPADMFKKGMNALGGIKEFVKKGSTVVVKPNIGWNRPPEVAANTKPALVAEIVRSCLSAGAKRVYVFDHTCDSWERTYETSGIKAAAKKAGAIVVTGARKKDYIKVRVPGGDEIKSQLVHRLIVESDVFINVPVLKSHGSTDVTIGMKNLMGVVWERRMWHIKDLHKCIAEFAAYRKPDLTVVDAYRVLLRNGPRGVSADDAVMMKYQVLARDPVAADAAAAKIFGVEPESIRHITLAHEKGIGNKNLKQLNIKRIII